MRVLASAVAFNEATKIGLVLDRFKADLADKVIVVDDGSDDGTPREVERRGIEIVRHDHRRGVGAAIRTAIRYAQRHYFDVIVILAGNDKDRPDEIPRLVAPIETGDFEVVQGSRYLGGGKIGGMPLYRRIATRMHPWFMSLATGHRFTDSTNGFRAIRLSLFDDARIDLDQDWLDAYELEPYILFKAARLGHRVTEVPVTKIYPPKKVGYTKMRPFVDWWSILRPIIFLAAGIKR